MPCGTSRETVKRSDLAGHAGYGYCASYSRYYWCLKLYLVCAGDGMPIMWCLAHPKIGEREVVAALLEHNRSLIRGGQVLLANFSPALDSSDLGKYGSFVALMQVLAHELRPAGDEGEAAFAGQSVRFPGTFTAEGAAVAIAGPGGAAVPPVLVSEGGRLAIHVDRPGQPGFYRLRRGETRLATLAVNLDPRESDLRRLAIERKLNMGLLFI